MAKTYDPIATYTAPSAQASYTFSSIPSTYTDLKLVIVGQVASANTIYIQFNGDTTTNYSYTDLTGDGTNATSSRGATRANLPISVWYTGISQIEFDVMNYSNTTTYKTVLSKATSPSTLVRRYVGLWRKTPEAINQIYFFTDGANYAIGTTFTLYGIKAA